MLRTAIELRGASFLWAVDLSKSDTVFLIPGLNFIPFLCTPEGLPLNILPLLYIGSAGIFACRHCYRLAYASQRETADDRAMRRADTIRRRLGWDAGIANLKGSKPKGMHWRTFERLNARHDAFAEASFIGMAAKLGIVNQRLLAVQDSLDARR